MLGGGIFITASRSCVDQTDEFLYSFAFGMGQEHTVYDKKHFLKFF